MHGMIAPTLKTNGGTLHMLKKLGFAALVSLVVVIASGCGSDSQPGAGAGGKVTNSELFQAVRAKLNGDPAIAAEKLSIDTNAEKNEVTLSGTVTSEDVRAKAVSLAQAAQPGIVVKDAMTVTASQVAAAPEPKPQAKKAASKPQPKKKSGGKRK
jgi:hypothetical protein